MQRIEVVYSPVCEATGAMIGKLKKWLTGTDVEIGIFPFHLCPRRLKSKFRQGENCFIDIFYQGERIDCVPLHQDRIYAALGIQKKSVQEHGEEAAPSFAMTGGQLAEALKAGEVQFEPINRQNYMEEMTMCLCNYPFGNPPKQFHKSCMEIKTQVFAEVWEAEEIAGIYGKYKGKVVGLLEVMPREILKKYGYMTGTMGNDSEYLSVGCYEVGCGMPRVEMINLLMGKLEGVFSLFRRRRLEGVGIYGWEDGFNPYWVYEKYGFEKAESLGENTVVYSRRM